MRSRTAADAPHRSGATKLTSTLSLHSDNKAEYSKVARLAASSGMSAASMQARSTRPAAEDANTENFPSCDTPRSTPPPGNGITGKIVAGAAEGDPDPPLAATEAPSAPDTPNELRKPSLSRHTFHRRVCRVSGICNSAEEQIAKATTTCQFTIKRNPTLILQLKLADCFDYCKFERLKMIRRGDLRKSPLSVPQSNETYFTISYSSFANQNNSFLKIRFDMDNS